MHLSRALVTLSAANASSSLVFLPLSCVYVRFFAFVNIFL